MIYRNIEHYSGSPCLMLREKKHQQHEYCIQLLTVSVQKVYNEIESKADRPLCQENSLVIVNRHVSQTSGLLLYDLIWNTFVWVESTLHSYRCKQGIQVHHVYIVFYYMAYYSPASTSNSTSHLVVGLSPSTC